jgi:hypothetical protein
MLFPAFPDEHVVDGMTVRHLPAVYLAAEYGMTCRDVHECDRQDCCGALGQDKKQRRAN